MGLHGQKKALKLLDIYFKFKHFILLFFVQNHYYYEEKLLLSSYQKMCKLKNVFFFKVEWLETYEQTQPTF